MSEIVLKDERWVYCERCQTAAYRYECCNNLSCTGAGCSVCGGESPVFLEVMRRLKFNLVPLRMRRIPDAAKDFLAIL